MPACTAELNLWVCDWNICPEQLRGFMWSSVEAMGQKRKTKEIWCFSQESLRLHCFVWGSFFPYLWILPLYPHPNHCIHERVFWKETKGGHTCGLECYPQPSHCPWALGHCWSLGYFWDWSFRSHPLWRAWLQIAKLNVNWGFMQVCGIYESMQKVRLLMWSVKGEMQREPALCFGKNQQEAAVCRSWYPEKTEKARSSCEVGRTGSPREAKFMKEEWWVNTDNY